MGRFQDWLTKAWEAWSNIQDREDARWREEIGEESPPEEGKEQGTSCAPDRPPTFEELIIQRQEERERSEKDDC